MAPITKENEVLTNASNAPSTATTSTGFRPDETASRPQPVALELPVTVNGARTVEGSDKREPFSETTKTVLVFGNGAVLRLSSPVAPGQLLFLTNEKTKKEVVCQVVKSKNYRNVSGYVELEFTESVVGFWGMRFPTDRIAPQPATAAPPVARITSIAPPPPAPARPTPLAQLPAAPPVVPMIPAAAIPPPKPLEVAAPQAQEPLNGVADTPVVEAAKPILPIAPETSVTSVMAAPLFAASAPVSKLPEPEPAVPAPSLASSVMSLLSSPEVPPAAPPAIAAKPPAQPIPFPTDDARPRNPSDSSTEELKLQAARLQEQLSSLVFAGSPEPKPTTTPLTKEDNARIAAKLLDLAKPETAAPKPAAPTKAVAPPVSSSLDSEEVKIPSWLEPLARNAAAPSSTHESAEKEKARRGAEVAPASEAAAEPEPTSAPTNPPEAELPGIGSLLPLDDGATKGARLSGGSNRGVWIGVAAAAVLLIGGGAWYLTHPATTVPSTTARNSTPVPQTASVEKSSVAALPDSAAVQPTKEAAPLNTAPLPDVAVKPSKSEAASTAPKSKSGETAQPVSVARDRTRDSAEAIPAAATEKIPKLAPASPAPAAAEPEPKKQSIGEVHLASPMVNRPTNAQDDPEAPSISSGAADSPAANIGSALEETSGEPTGPAAPLPVGGDVKPARLLSSVPPSYPSIAKSQHVAGDVQIDALIDANGKVTTMKVMSGPSLLYQAAMEALRQWKYSPATLDGKPVPMHLSVTLKFRTQ